VKHGLTFSDDKVTIEIGGNNLQETLRLDLSKKPKQIDIEGGEGPPKGIHELKGDELRLCFDAKRPSECKAAPDVSLFVLKREKR